MKLNNLSGWNNETEKMAAASCGSACGASEPEKKPEPQPASCGSACGAAAPEEKPEQKPTACGSACGAGSK